LIEDLLDLAKLEKGGLPIHPQPESLNKLVEQGMKVIREQASQKLIDIFYEAPQDDLTVICDFERILQVFSNLLGNAVKFSPEKSEVRIQVITKPDHVEILIRDQGPGVNEQELPRVFDRYWQSQYTEQRTSASGSGLGLYISKGIVESHGGRIWLESKLGFGSTFGFTLSRQK
jgi:chemotaxis family two-component system sensor kinase Cph1